MTDTNETSNDKKECCGGMCCPITGVNIPRFALCVIVSFAYIFGFDYFVHGNLLMGLYEQTTDLWRPQETMQEFFPMMLTYQALLAVVLGLIFTRNYEAKGIMEGVRFGILLGALIGLLNAAAYIWMPIPSDLALGWAAAGFGIALGVGVIFSLLYRK